MTRGNEDQPAAAGERPRPHPRPNPWVWVALPLLLMSSIVVAAARGSTDHGFWVTLKAFLEWIGLPVHSGLDRGSLRVLEGLRFPRIIVAALAGACLGVAAVLLQRALRNRQAAPITTGASAGALLGASVALAIFDAGGLRLGGVSAATGSLWVRLGAAAVGAFAAQWVVVRSAAHGGRVLPAPLLVAGLAVNAVVGSAAALLLFLAAAGDQTAARVIVTWGFGGLLGAATATSLAPAATGLVLVLALTIPLARPLDLFVLGEDVAASSGIDVQRTRYAAIALAAIGAGTAVAVAGIVAFVGLVAALAAQHLVGARTRHAMPAAAMLGAVGVVLVDLIGRTIVRPGEVPAGVIAAFVGAPVLFVLLRGLLREVDA